MPMLLNFLTLQTLSHANMNGNVYDISNPNPYSQIKFSTNYNQINSSYEQCLFTSITSRYADVC